MSIFLALFRNFRLFDTADIGDGGSADSAGSPPADAGAGDGLPAETPPPGEGSGAGSPPAADGNIKQLRTAYEGLKAKYQSYESLGDAATLQQQMETFKAVQPFVEEIALQAGMKLGYTEQQIRDSLKDDFAGTVSFLRGKQVEAEKKGQSSSPELQDALDKISALEKKIQPLEEGRKEQKYNAARETFDELFNQQIAELFKGVKLEDKEENYLWKLAFDLLSSDRKALNAFVEEGKTADVLKYIQQAKNEADVYFLTRTAREKKRTSKPGEVGKPASDESGNKYTLSDLAHGVEPPRDHPLYESWRAKQTE